MRRVEVLVACLACVLTMSLCGRALAQGCEPQWQSTGLAPGTNGVVLALCSWDPDGAGPQPAQVVAAGTFTNAGGIPASRIARWDGATWQPMGAGVNTDALALTTWDPDGSGPSPAQLIAGGSFWASGDTSLYGVGRWDGTEWQPLGVGMSAGPTLWARIYALISWDPDGDGPLPAQLVAAGYFTTAGGTAANHIARWDGSAWRPLGAGMNNTIFSLTTWDPDGSGPLPAQLVAGGFFTTAGGAAANHVARWNGAAWSPIGTGVSGTVHSLTTWDPDGDGPLPAQLVVGGNFTSAGGAPANNVARWDGTAWQPFGTGMNGDVAFLTTWDSDGAGPMAAQLVAAGAFHGIARWDGAVWASFRGGMDGSVAAVTTWDPDGAGPLPAQLFAGGYFAIAGGMVVNSIARWDGTAWRAVGTGLSDYVRALTPWDPDGPGATPEHLVAGGDFATAGGTIANHIAHWDGAAWRSFGTGVNGSVEAVAAWDPDGPGPLPAHVVAGGSFTAAGFATASHVALWDGSAWQPLGLGFDGDVHALATWDPDGDGPLSAQVVAGGSFSRSAGMEISNIARWDGSVWQPLGTGIPGVVWALETWDPDGDGPLPEQLVAGGNFVTAGGITVNSIASWNGTAWQPLGSGLGGNFPYVFALTTWDPDGAGPLAKQLIAGGWFSTAGGTPAVGIARWDGAAWWSMRSGSIHALAAWDPDGPGPLPPQLVAGGAFGTASGTTVTGIAHWDGTEWLPFGTAGEGAYPYVNALTTWDPSGTGPSLPQLAAGGTFASSGGLPSSYAAIYGCTSPVCPADLDNGSGTGTRDGAVTIDDLLYFLGAYEAGNLAADLDDGSGNGVRDGAVTIDDLLFFLTHYEAGC